MEPLEKISFNAGTCGAPASSFDGFSHRTLSSTSFDNPYHFPQRLALGARRHGSGTRSGIEMFFAATTSTSSKANKASGMAPVRGGRATRLAAQQLTSWLFTTALAASAESYASPTALNCMLLFLLCRLVNERPE